MSDNVHPLRKQLKNLTPELCRRLQNEMLVACEKVAGMYGLTVSDGGSKDTSRRQGFQFSVRVDVPQSDGSIFDPEKALFEVLAESYGLRADDYGREFTTGGDIFRITAINPRRPKYPISVERQPDRRRFKFTADDIAMYLNAPKR